MEPDESLDSHDDEIALELGERLRNIREQQGMSLQDVERKSNGDLKASVVGAYERAERAVTLVRLQRIAEFYGVPLARLLPDRRPASLAEVSRRGGLRIMIDELDRRRDDDDMRIVGRYVRSLQERRGDYNGRVITIRMDDVDAMAAVLAMEPHALERLLVDSGIATHV